MTIALKSSGRAVEQGRSRIDLKEVCHVGSGEIDAERELADDALNKGVDVWLRYDGCGVCGYLFWESERQLGGSGFFSHSAYARGSNRIRHSSFSSPPPRVTAGGGGSCGPLVGM
jgi:hypothetical protein